MGFCLLCVFIIDRNTGRGGKFQKIIDHLQWSPPHQVLSLAQGGEEKITAEAGDENRGDLNAEPVVAGRDASPQPCQGAVLGKDENLVARFHSETEGSKGDPDSDRWETLHGRQEPPGKTKAVNQTESERRQQAKAQGPQCGTCGMRAGWPHRRQHNGIGAGAVGLDIEGLIAAGVLPSTVRGQRCSM